MYKALTIAGSDSGGGAGIQTDLKTFAALGVYGTSVISALTAQNTKGVHGIHAVPADFVTCQLDAVLSDIPVQAAKTGMLEEAKIIEAVADGLTRYRLVNLVVDPVMVAESGDRLLNQNAVEALRSKLLPLALLVTPNLPEAGVLLGREIQTVDEMIRAARDIYSLGPRSVLVKGGHLPGKDMVDIFFDGKDIYRFCEHKLETVHTHGTGCTYSAAITANLSRGMTTLDAVRHAKKFITEAISHGIRVGSGYGPTNPMGSLWQEVRTSRTEQALYAAEAIIRKAPSSAKLLGKDLPAIYFCREDAKSTDDIAELQLLPASCFQSADLAAKPSWGKATQTAEILLSVQHDNTATRAAISIQYSATMIHTAKSLSLTIADGINFNGRPADLLILRDKSDSARILFFAPTPADAAQKLIELSRQYFHI